MTLREGVRSVGSPGARISLVDGLLGLVFGSLVGALVVVQPRALLLLLVVIALLLMRTAKGRFLIFVLGNIVTSASSAAVSTPKLLFMGLALVIGFVAIVRSSQFVTTAAGAHLKPLLVASAAVGIAVVLAAAKGFATGAAPVDIARDAVSYVLLVLAFPIAIDASASMSHQSVMRFVIPVGLVSTVSYTVNTLSARGFDPFPIDKLFFGSFATVALFFAVGIVQSQGSAGRMRGLLYAALATSGVLLSGTRIGLTLFAGLFGLVGRRRRGAIATGKVIVTGILAGGVTAASIVLFAPHVASAEFFVSRAKSGLAVLTTGVGADQSAQFRADRYDIALKFFQSSPMLGHGFGGFATDNVGISGIQYYLDTPLLLPAKFGAVGTSLILLALVVLFCTLLRGSDGNSERKRARMITRSFMWVLIASVPFGAITENKGFATTIAMLVVLVATTQHCAAPNQDEGITSKGAGLAR